MINSFKFAVAAYFLFLFTAAQADWFASSGDPLIDNLRLEEIKIRRLTAEGKYRERFDLERKIETRYGRQIAQGVRQSSETLIRRIQTINAEFAGNGRTLESTEPLREAASRYQAYRQLMKFSDETSLPEVQIQEATQASSGNRTTRIRLLRNGKAVAELEPKTLEFLKASEVLALKPNSPQAIREYEVIRPVMRSNITPGRIELKAFEPDKSVGAVN